MLQIDLPMPEACDVCPFNYDFCWCSAFKDNEFDKYSDDWNKQVCDGEHRPEYCPLEEVPQIVRCKDCKWWDKKDDSKYGYCHACKHGHHSEHWEIGIYRVYKEDWFCADGERE